MTVAKMYLQERKRVKGGEEMWLKGGILQGNMNIENLGQFILYI